MEDSIEHLDNFKGEKEILWEIEKKETLLSSLEDTKSRLSTQIEQLRSLESRKGELEAFNTLFQETVDNIEKIKKEIENLKEGLLQIKSNEGMQLNG